KINSLKVSRNKVYGFYIEIPKTQIAKVPAYYTRKQTLVNTERFTIEELRQIEQKLSLAEDRIKAIEKELFDKIILELEKYVTEIKQLSDRLAELDVFRSFAEASVKYNYIRPKMIEKSRNTKIINGRHAVVERFVSKFIPNDSIFEEDGFYIILTGPNMSGQSTYVRQIGLISIMAPVGCFVPAEVAELPVYDRLFT